MRFLSGMWIAKPDASRVKANMVAIHRASHDAGFAGFRMPAFAADSLCLQSAWLYRLTSVATPIALPTTAQYTFGK
jgi:hypothetical protein